MGSISDYLENELLDHVLGVGAYTPPATVYIGYSTADPTDDGSGIAEPGNGYAREICAFGAAGSRAIANSGLITFDQASGAQGTITHWFLCDHLSNTNWGTDVHMLAHGSLAAPKVVVSGNTPSIAIGQVDVEFNSGDVSDYLANKLLDFAFRNQAFSPPTIYIALCTVAVGDSDTGSTITEPSGNNYARKAHSAWDAAAAGASENTGAITFNTPSGSWGECVDVAILDALTAGNLLFYSSDPENQTPSTGDTVSFADGALDITLS